MSLNTVKICRLSMIIRIKLMSGGTGSHGSKRLYLTSERPVTIKAKTLLSFYLLLVCVGTAGLARPSSAAHYEATDRQITADSELTVMSAHTYTHTAGSRYIWHTYTHTFLYGSHCEDTY